MGGIESSPQAGALILFVESRDFDRVVLPLYAEEIFEAPDTTDENDSEESLRSAIGMDGRRGGKTGAPSICSEGLRTGRGGGAAFAFGGGGRMPLEIDPFG